ncbi:DUF4148 domain-containing protein [Paraburkholderia sp. J12]|uniref:DUF4148 domain-containing protein n=1 Tax=Paraburkholderia sp. J12 TaxID=2805432 RepID=UPI002ABD1F72|nr:DUF4148 domain-containing protein [Paraburkholderia sp. J12]
MKALATLALAVCALSAPVLSFAQSNAPVTRAEVRAKLIQLEKAGYNPNTDGSNYPEDIQAAEAKVAAEQANSAVGGSTMSGTSAAGAPTATHHIIKPGCVGPASFCNVYFGG